MGFSIPVSNFHLIWRGGGGVAKCTGAAGFTGQGLLVLLDRGCWFYWTGAAGFTATL